MYLGWFVVAYKWSEKGLQSCHHDRKPRQKSLLTLLDFFWKVILAVVLCV